MLIFLARWTVVDADKEDELEIPILALREAIINAIAHRDYSSKLEIQVNIFNIRFFPTVLDKEFKTSDRVVSDFHRFKCNPPRKVNTNSSELFLM